MAQAVVSGLTRPWLHISCKATGGDYEKDIADTQAPLDRVGKAVMGGVSYAVTRTADRAEERRNQCRNPLTHSTKPAAKPKPGDIRSSDPRIPRSTRLWLTRSYAKLPEKPSTPRAIRPIAGPRWSRWTVPFALLMPTTMPS